MTPLELDYQGQARRIPWLGALVLLLALAAATSAAMSYQGLMQQTAYWELRADQSNKASAPNVKGAPGESEEIAMEIRYANDVLNRITLPWGKLFQAVEWSAGTDVALLGMEPNADKSEIRISGEAKNLVGVLQYLKHLAAQDIVSSVYLQSHQVQPQNPDRPVRFTLVATWRAMP